MMHRDRMNGARAQMVYARSSGSVGCNFTGVSGIQWRDIFRHVGTSTSTYCNLYAIEICKLICISSSISSWLACIQSNFTDLYYRESYLEPCRAAPWIR